MRVIAGRARGRTLLGPPSQSATRPTSDRVRQALFDLLGARVVGACVLDLCAGTGALGLEALSRGARFAAFVEQSAPMARVLQRNIDALEARANSLLVVRDVRRAAPLLAPHGPYDLLLLDPPWDSGLDALALGAVLDAGLLAPGALCVVEHRAGRPPALDAASANALALHDERRWGDSGVTLYIHTPADTGAAAP